MDYQNHYNKLMERAPKKRPKGVYLERHRIIPGCMGGKYIFNNIAFLTPEEHYVAHQLLVKIHPNNFKLKEAVHMLTVSKTGTLRNNKEFGWVRKHHSQAVSIRMKGSSNKKGTKHSKPFSEEYRQNRAKSSHSRKWVNNGSISKFVLKTEILDSDWVEGRISFKRAKASIETINKRKEAYAKVDLTCPHCNLTGKRANLKRYHFDNCKFGIL